MLLINTSIFICGMIIMLVLLKIYQSLSIKEEEKPTCDFKFSSIKYKKNNDTTTAFFNVKVSNKHRFFIDFPVLFKFFSDNRFKSKIRINYKSSVKGSREEIINKTIIFETKTQEYIHYINDIIIGELFIEIEVRTDYGKPIIAFSILENKICKLGKEFKIEISFP